ncbi:MAG: methionine--tRNA ligase, partial [Candidatus Micrarchaeota archaeon]
DKSGDIYKKKYRGLYCVGCEAFYEESELPGGICPEHGKKPEIVEEENYFFKLSKYQDKLVDLIESGKLQILPKSRKNEVLSFIRGGLKDFSISRSIKRAKGWGVPVPNDPTQIEYVWFDALGTYLTGIGYGTDDEKFGGYWPADVHVIGKGILRFHAVYWPAILLSAGLELPKTIFVHGYITVEGQKMSKSLGNIIDPFFLTKTYGVDPLRYCLLSEVPTFDDGDFSEKALVEKNNTELLANLGNLVNRTMVFLKNNFDGKVPEGRLQDVDEEFLKAQKKTIQTVTGLLDDMELKEALQHIMHFTKNTNKYFQDNKPWEAVKSDKERAGTLLYVLINQVKDAAILVAPYMPHTSNGIFSQLNIKAQEWNNLGDMSVHSGHPVGDAKILFTKLDPKEIQEKDAPKTPVVSFLDLDLEVGEITAIERHPDAEKLYIEKVRLGDGEIQIVSGLVPHYSEEQLLGKRIVVLRNLLPAKLRGVESQGMLLVADTEGDMVEVFDCKDAKVGDKITAEGIESKPKGHISFKEFGKVKLEVKDYLALAEGKALSAGGQRLKTTKIKDGKIS